MALEDRIRLPNLNLIHRRPRLLRMLEGFVESHHRLITIYAPGGYGKSILLADFAQTTNLPVCWCSLEDSDRDPTAFLTLLAYSITDRFHEIEPDSLLRLIERGDTQNSIRRIAEVLSEVGDHILIVDDYHKAVSAGMILALNRLLERLPDASTVIVAARGDMTLETGQIIDLLIAERATGLSEEELKFTGEEIQLVMRKRFGRRIGPDEADEIAQVTDGNVAQILLTGHMMHAHRLISHVKQRLGDDQDIVYSFLAEEVLAKEPPELQQFMLHTAVLPEMTAELSNALLEIDHAQELLDELVKKDLFITKIGTGFRYHDLFANFLRTKLAEDTLLHRQVSLKAAEILAAQTRYEEAIYLYLSIKAWDEAASLLDTQGKHFFNTGRASTLNTWLSQIPEEELLRRPRLLLLHGQILVNNLGKIEPALNLFKRAEVLFLAQDDHIAAAEAQVWQSIGLRMTGQARESLTLVTSALTQLLALKASDQTIAAAIKYRGMAHWVAGNVVEALDDYQRALEMFEKIGDTYNIGVCHQEVGICQDVQGNVSSANHHFKQAFRIWETLGSASDMANTLNSLGVSLCTVGQYDEALKYFNESLDVALQIGATHRAAVTQAGVGDAHLGRRAYNLAETAYQTSTELASEAGVQRIKIYNLVKIGECAYEQQDFLRALELSNRAKELALELGLRHEHGLACVLVAKIYIQRSEFVASFNLLQEASECFGQNDMLEQAKTRLWWAYSLLLELRASAAFEQLQEALKLTLSMGELTRGLSPTIEEVQLLLRHFLYWPDTPVGLKDSIRILLKQREEIAQESPSNLQIFLFGPPLMTAGDHRRQFSQRGRLRKMPEFLAYLALEGQNGGCRWSEVCAAIWPELEPNKASSRFHQTLRRLRELFADLPDYIMTEEDYYYINPAYLQWCDVLAFEKLRQRIARTADAAEALALQRELIALYRGEFLAGFEVEEWGFTQRTSFETSFLQTAKLAAEQLVAIGSAQEALSVLRSGLAIDFFREDLHRVALKAYHQLRMYDQLAAHYAELTRLFHLELNAPPDPTTEALYSKLMSVRQVAV